MFKNFPQTADLHHREGVSLMRDSPTIRPRYNPLTAIPGPRTLGFHPALRRCLLPNGRLHSQYGRLMCCHKDRLRRGRTSRTAATSQVRVSLGSLQGIYELTLIGKLAHSSVGPILCAANRRTAFCVSARGT